MNDPCRKTIPSETYSRDLMFCLGQEDYLTFLNTRGVLLRPRILQSLNYGAVAVGMWVLDAGCGRGEVLFRSAQAGANAVGIDYSIECVRLAKETLAEMGQVPSLAAADATALPFADGSFDRIFLLDVVEHLYEHEAIAVMKELRRVLKPQGFIVVHTLPNRWALSAGYRLIRLLARWLPEEPRSDIEKEIHVNEQDILSLHRIMDKAGLSSHIWVEGTILEQFGWEGGGQRGHSARRRVYGLFQNPAIRAIYRLAMRSPLRLLFANDLYCIAWIGKDRRLPAGRQLLPSAYLERALFHLLLNRPC